MISSGSEKTIRSTRLQSAIEISREWKTEKESKAWSAYMRVPKHRVEVDHLSAERDSESQKNLTAIFIVHCILLLMREITFIQKLCKRSTKA